MLVVPSRRELLNAALSMPLVSASNSKSLALCANIIASYVPRDFLEAVSNTKCFLYRGENSISTFEVLAPEPDLLIPNTYENPAALEYFQCLEKRLNTGKVDAIPSKGHIAISDETEASQWGEAVSIWPLGTTFSFIWPKKGKLLFPPSEACPNDDLAINHDLEMALTLGHEVLFTSAFDSPTTLPGFPHIRQAAFLAVSSKYNGELRSTLNI